MRQVPPWIARAGVAGLAVLALGAAGVWTNIVLAAMARPTPEELSRGMPRNEVAIRAWPGQDSAPPSEAPDRDGWSVAVVVSMPSASDQELTELGRAAAAAASMLPPQSRLVLVEDRRVMDPQMAPADLEGRTEIGTGLSTALDFLTEDARTNPGRRSFRVLIVADGPAASTFEEMELRSTAAHIVQTTPIELSTIVVGRHHLDALDLPGLADYRTADAATLAAVLVSEITRAESPQ